MEHDQTYFMRRAAQERSAASNAADAKARKAHQVMAERYSDLVQTTGEQVVRSDAA